MRASLRGTSGQQFSLTGRKVLVLVGPTAAGKTSVSLSLAQNLCGEIISADSRQIYKHMNIGTAKASMVDRWNVPHYFVDECEPGENFNAGEFGKRGRVCIDDILARRKVPIVVGGSGLYLRAVIDGFFDGPSADPSIRNELYRRSHEEGNDVLLDELRRIDPVAAGRMLPSNIRRIVRALEVYYATGTTISYFQKKEINVNFVSVWCGLQWDRAKLYARINRRVDRMIDDGFLEEARELQRLDMTPTATALQTVGYKEAFAYLHGKLEYGKMIDLMKMNSRRYAKRQMTWFRQNHRIRWFEVQDESDLPGVALKIRDHFSSNTH